MTWLLSPVAFAAKWLQAGSRFGILAPEVLSIDDVDQTRHKNNVQNTCSMSVPVLRNQVGSISWWMAADNGSGPVAATLNNW
jgi:hypothetical protein